jgi:hypothetical protein
MGNTKILSLLWLASTNNLNNFLSSDSDSIYIKLKNINSGNSGKDERYNEYLNVTLLNNIRRNIINKNIIQELENDRINIHKKLNIIEKYTEIYENQNRINGFNLFAGNLANDFYNDGVDGTDITDITDITDGI